MSKSKKKENNFVTIKDFETSFDDAKAKYLYNLQFKKQNPKEISSIKNLIGPEYEVWVLIYNLRDTLIKKKEIAYKKITKFDYNEILLGYSGYIEPIKDKTTAQLFLDVNDFLRNVKYYKNKQKTQQINEYRMVDLIEIISLAEKYRLLLHLFEMNISLYAYGNLPYEIFLKNNLDNFFKFHKNLNALEILYDQEVVLKSEIAMYYDIERKINPLLETKKSSYIFNANIAATMVNDRYDSEYKFITTKRIYSEVGCYYFLKDICFDHWEKGLIKNNDNFRRISCSKFYSSIEEFKLTHLLIGEAIEEDPLQTFLMDLNNNINKQKNNKLNYAFFKFNNYIYTNRKWLDEINMGDHLFSYFWANASKEEQKKFSDNYELFVSKILGDSYSFNSRNSVKYKKDGCVFEIDIVAEDENTIIFGEIKTTNVKEYYSSIIDNIKRNLNGKATNQLTRLKKHLNDLNVLNQIKITEESIKNKNLFFVIFSMTPDGIGQTNTFISVNLFLLEQMLCIYLEENKNITLEQSYEICLKKIKMCAKEGIKYKVNASFNKCLVSTNSNEIIRI
jgi:hypothetical protein